MNFSKLKLNKLAESTHQAYFDAEGRNSKATGQTGAASKALVKQQTRPQRNNQLKGLQTQGNNQRTGQVTKGTPIAGTPTPRSGGYDRKFSEEHFRELRLEQEMTKRLQERRSDWRSELIESAEAIDKEMHPYVDVMPRADQNARTLKKQMAGEVVDKVGKDLKQEGYAPGDVDERLGAVASIPKKDQEDAKARLLAKAKAKREKMKKEEIEQINELAPVVAAVAGKGASMLAGKAATAGAAKAGGSIAKAASSKVGQAAISAGSDAIGNKVEKKMSEEVEDLEEAKKKCKTGYKYDKKKKKCVKKKKSSSSSKKSSPTYVYIGRPGYGGGYHHHHHGDGGSNGGDGGDGGDNGGDSNGGGGDAGGGGE